MINSVNIRKMLSKRCVAFMAHIVNRSDEIVLGVKDTSMVQEFPNIFTDNLSKLALERKVKSNIELAICTTPISKAPYKMTLVEL